MFSKNQIVFFLATCFFIASFPSCTPDDVCIKGEGDAVAQEFSLGDFNGIDLDISADVQIIQGNEYKIAASGQQNILDDLVLTVSNGILQIDLLNGCYDYNNLLFNITMPTITHLEIDGSGSINGFSPITTDAILLKIDGSGNISLGMTANDVQVDLDGSGSFSLGGETTSFDVNIDGSGAIEAFELEAQDVSVNISGSGDTEVFATQTLDIIIDGSGSVSYKGNPTITQMIDGSGDLIDAN